MQIHPERMHVQLRLALTRCGLRADRRKAELNAGCDTRLDILLTRVDVLGEAAVAGDCTQLHHLLSHSSGVPNSTNFEGYNDEFKGRLHTPQQLYAYFSGRELSFEPGARFEYSNSGYALLGMLIESVSGQSYGEYLAEAVSRPAGLTATAYAPGVPPADAANGYHPDRDDRLIQTA